MGPVVSSPSLFVGSRTGAETRPPSWDTTAASPPLSAQGTSPPNHLFRASRSRQALWPAIIARPALYKALSLLLYPSSSLSASTTSTLLLSLHFLPHPGVRPCSFDPFLSHRRSPASCDSCCHSPAYSRAHLWHKQRRWHHPRVLAHQRPDSGSSSGLDEGDDISVKVVNKGHEPVTMHWHGIEQVGSLWSDGVPGLTQWPIPVQGDFVYNFTVKQAGFHWYHSHYKMQLDDGLKGTIYIRPRPNKPKPFSQISTDAAVLEKLKQAENNALLLNVYDYKHYTSEHWMAEWERTDIEQLCIDNLLRTCDMPGHEELNAVANAQQKPLTKKGCMQPSSKLMYPYPGSKPDIVEPAMWTECTNSNTTFEVFSAKQSDGWVAFNLLNSGALWDLRVSIDSHKLYFFAADGHYTKIQTATSLLIPVGKRYQFFVKLDQTPATTASALLLLFFLSSSQASPSFATLTRPHWACAGKDSAPAKKPVSSYHVLFKLKH
ncbi:multicopper oxidase family [Rhizoctonia solani]|uniref:Multicopper oxidase family n=1 Tax=Rhizoctonia solani TaxID=456999 RepID=A0A8H7I131_9AGAM|nr:multicopper oxidase family [Rhizoctonia solani]